MFSKYLIGLFIVGSVVAYYNYTNLKIEQLEQELAIAKKQLHINKLVCKTGTNISIIRKDFEDAKQDKNISDGNHTVSFDWAF